MRRRIRLERKIDIAEEITSLLGPMDVVPNGQTYAQDQYNSVIEAFKHFLKEEFYKKYREEIHTAALRYTVSITVKSLVELNEGLMRNLRDSYSTEFLAILVQCLSRVDFLKKAVETNEG